MKHLVRAALAAALLMIGASCATPASGGGCQFGAGVGSIRVVAEGGTPQNVILYGIAASNNWNAAQSHAPFLNTSATPNLLTITFGARYAPNEFSTLGQTIPPACPFNSGYFWLNTASIDRAGTWAAAHELGHTLGLAHHPFKLGLDYNLVPSDCGNTALMHWKSDAYSVCGIQGPTGLDLTTINNIYN
jgi:hypothetical protein